MSLPALGASARPPGTAIAITRSVRINTKEIRMYKRTSISATFSAIVFTMLCLFPSVVGAQAPQEQQQKDPPPAKKSRSNINNNKMAGAGSEVLVVDLNKASGEKVASSQLADADNDGKLSEAESVFDFDVLPAGDYVLTLRSVEGRVESVKSDLTARVSITGTVVGKVEKDWKLETNKAADATSPSQRLGGLSSDFGQFKIPFKTDGKMSIAGKITLPNGGIVIRNIKKPA
jgi:hypothetical protein